ncbi:MAG TPA: ATP-binding protein [candidate division Zixibacteria bacterium]|nr:ATP-binding protein [candidate division Zixibacteria bacterium]
MTIRAKLLLSYSIAFAAALTVGASGLQALLSWRESTADVADMYAQELRAELLRAEEFLLVGHGESFLWGDLKAQSEFEEAERRVVQLLQDIVEHSTTDIERDHINGLSETHTELVWIMEGYFSAQRDTARDLDREAAEERLEEIGVEVSDDVTVLGRYYQEQRQLRLAAAETVGTRATIIIAAVVGLTLLVLLLAVVFIRRWLSGPIQEISRTTAKISAGDFHARAALQTADEWGALATDINEMAASLERLQEDLRSQERLAALGEIAAYAAHNIRNPLSGVRAAAQVSLTELPHEERVVRSSLNEMIAAIDRLDLWMQRLLDFAKPLSLTSAPCDLNRMVTTAAALIKGAHAHRRVTLNLNLADNLPAVYGDDAMLEQVFASTLTNAYEAIGEEGTITLTTVAGRDAVRGHCVCVEINDTGGGVAPEMQNKIFGLFASGKQHGAGLGLAQAKRIVDTHGGTIEITSAPGAGATVTIVLPCRAQKTESHTG